MNRSWARHSGPPLHLEPWLDRKVAPYSKQLPMPGRIQGKCAVSFARNIWSGLLAVTALTAIGTISGEPALAQQPQKPNILVIMADDIGYWNISAYNRGMMGYRTPNIDRIADEGAIFTDYYDSNPAPRAAQGSSPDKVPCEPDS